MFDNIGKKIKSLATVITWIGIILWCLIGFSLFRDGKTALYGLLVMVGGGILSWLSSLLLYGFGELVDNSTVLAESAAKRKQKNEKVEKLRERGLLTDEEYCQAKAQIEQGEL